MELGDIRNDGIGNNNTDVALSMRNDRLDKVIRFYRRKFHFISIPVGILFSAIHLKFAIEYLGQCSIQPMINIYMIVHASVTLVLILLALIGVIIVHCIYSRSEEDNNQITARRLILIVIMLSLILFLFSFAWLVTGSVWIFGAKTHGVQGSNSNDTTTYCQSDLYRAAFVLIIVNYVVHTIIILLFVLRHVCCKRENIIPPNFAEKDRV
jgi:hypothetical protein